MDLIYLEKEDYSKWDEFVDNSPQGSIFAKSWYLNALGVDYKILAVTQKDSIKAGIVLAKNEINTFSNPMLDKYLGVILEKREGNIHKRLSNEYKYINMLSLELKKIKSFDYYFHPSFDNWIVLSWNGFTQQTRYTYRIFNKDNSIEEIYNKFHSNIKNDIKNAQRENILIKRDISFDDLWDLVTKTFLRQGGKPPYNKEKLKRYIKRVGESFISFGAYKDNRCIAVVGIAYERKSAYLLLNGIDIDNKIRGANTYLIYKAIEFMHSRCDYFDFEGSMLIGVEQFYRRFGGELTPYYRIWNDNFFNYAKTKLKKLYKKIRYGR